MVSRKDAHDYVHPRELFDMCRLPSLNRVAPLAQSLRGRYQFFAGKKDCPMWLRIASAGYYALLKVASLTVFFGLPSWALWSAFRSLSPEGYVRYPLDIGGALAAATLLHVFLSDALYSMKVLRLLFETSN